MLALLAPVIASAVPICSTSPGVNTLTSYMALGSGGCQLDDFVFSNFTYTYNLSSVGMPAYYSSTLGFDPGDFGTVTPADVTVNPTVSGIGEVNIQIGNASWLVNGWQVATLSISFDVTMLTNDLKEVTGSFTGSGVNAATTSFFASVAPPNAATNILTLPGSTYIYPTVPAGYPVNVLLLADLRANSSAACLFCAPGQEGQAEDYIYNTAYGNLAHLSDINITFAEDRARIPEPGTWLTAVAGLGLAGFIKRRRAA
ncbi:MAG: PEP-CTERM sorting domain-containing protein [Candidatus Solibacter sp.]